MADSAMVPSAQVRSFRQLLVWQHSMDLAVEVHRAAGEMPNEVRFELAREMRRSSVSVPSNIAEGFARHSRRVYRAHTAIALGSDAELSTQIELAGRLHYLEGPHVARLLEQTATVGRLLQGLWSSLGPCR